MTTQNQISLGYFLIGLGLGVLAGGILGFIIGGLK